MIHLAPRATSVAPAGIMLAALGALASCVSIAGAQGPSIQPAMPRPAVRNPTARVAQAAPMPPAVPSPAGPSVEGPTVLGPGSQGSDVEGLPAYENESPFADVLQPPAYPGTPHAGSAADAPYAADAYPGDYHPSLPGRIRTYLDNRPRQQPLQTESWLNRPFSASFLLGGVFLDDPLPGIEGDAGVFYGGRLGWDFAPHFGMEGRMGGGSAGISSSTFAVDLPQANLFFFDINWLWYPTGDTRWRPYFLAGTGLFNIDFTDIFVHRYHDSLFEIPLGVGLKYRYSTRTVMRFEFTDNYGLGSGLLQDQHNLSFTAGLETRFGGGNHKSYFPWKPDRNWR